jgi:PAS domain S-box-containing protein
MARTNPPLPPASILLVDDNPANLLALEAVLEGLDARLVRATSGAEALAKLDREEFAVILLDVRMPGMDGYEVARRVRACEQTRHLPIIFVTAHEATDSVVVQAYKDGAADHMVKPLVPSILRAKVGGFLQLHRQWQHIAQLEREAAERRIAEEHQRAETARLWAEDARTRLAAIVESSDDAIIGKDMDGIITSWNPGAERLYGYTSDDVLGKRISLLFPPDHADELPGIMDRLKRGERVEPFDTVRRRKDGSLVPVCLSVSPIKDTTGKVAGASAIARNMTRLQRSEAELRRANEAKDQFLAMLGHELRNPLAPLRNALHVLHQRGADPPTVSWVHDVAVRQVEQLTRLVDDLLDVTRLQQRKIRLRPEPVDLATLVRTTAQDYAPILEGAGLTLELDVPARPVRVRGDSVRLSQVVSNLVDNAAKFNRPGGQVAVQVKTDDDAEVAEVTVRDTGIGIDGDLLPRVFETFAQGETGLDRSRGGLGLGLTLVKGLVELHAGNVRAESAGPGTGATFSFRLPLDVRAAVEAPDPVPPVQRTGRRLSVLVIEDHVDAADSMRVLLEMAGHRAFVACSGPAGLEAARSIHPDAVICDVGLPGLDGYQVARALRADPVTARATLIALTGYGLDDDRRRARAAGFDHHLTKPVDPGAVLRLLSTVNPRHAQPPVAEAASAV